MKRNAGSVLLSQSGKTSEEIAIRVGVSRALASHWLSGLRKPVNLRREALRTQFGIPLTAWDEFPARKKVRVRDVELVAYTAETRAAEMRRQLDGMIQAAAKMPAAEAARILRLVAETDRKMNEGNELKISEARIIKSPAFAKILEAIKEGLANFPEAASALDKHLLELSKR